MVQKKKYLHSRIQFIVVKRPRTKRVDFTPIILDELSIITPLPIYFITYVSCVTCELTQTREGKEESFRPSTVQTSNITEINVSSYYQHKEKHMSACYDSERNRRKRVIIIK